MGGNLQIETRGPVTGIVMALVAVLVGACVPSMTLEERTGLLDGHLQYFAPEGGGPAPLVILVSGCGGLVGEQGPKPIMTNYARVVVDAGAYAVIVDSLGARHIDFQDARSKVCGAKTLRGAERAGDIIAAEKLARSHWKMNFENIILAGWSHGGWSVMELLSRDPDTGSIGGLHFEESSQALSPEAVILVYPYCGILNTAWHSHWDFHGPLLHISGDQDDISPHDKCLAILKHALGEDDTITSVVLKDATHAFDEPDHVATSRFVYNPQATAEAEQLVHDFVEKQVKNTVH